MLTIIPATNSGFGDYWAWFNLDHDFYVRYPFDGLIIYPPRNLAPKIFNATIADESVPDFNIKTIEIVNMEFAKKAFQGTLFFE